MNDDPRLGSYLAIAGGVAVAGVNVLELYVDGKLLALIEQQEQERAGTR